MRALIPLLMVATLLAGCTQGNPLIIRTNPVLPDALTVRAIYSGTREAQRFVSIAIEGGSNYTHYRPADSIMPNAATSGFYRFDYQSPNKRPLLLVDGYRFSVNQTTSPRIRWTQSLQGVEDSEMTFQGPNPDGGGFITVQQTVSTSQFPALSAGDIAGQYTAVLATENGRTQPMRLEIKSTGEVSTVQCRLVGRADAYKNASVARLRITIPANNGCGLKAAQDITGVLFFENANKAYLMADARDGENANGLYGELTRDAVPARY